VNGNGTGAPHTTQALTAACDINPGTALVASASVNFDMLFRRFCILAFMSFCTLAAGCAAQDGKDVGSGPPQRLRVMTYNVHHGRGADDAIDLRRIAKVINAARPDVVVLQEVDVRTRRSGGVDQLAELSRLTKMHGRFGKGRDFEGGDYGQAILSKRRIAEFNVHALPPANEADRRIAIDARLAGDANHPEVRIVGTHLHHVSEAFRVAQARRIAEILGPEAGVILTGDLNAVPGSPTIDFLFERWEDAAPDTGWTYPATQPTKKIDWVLLPKGHRWRVVERVVIDERVASDHRPVVIELVLAPE
jgi:endonuclease/exonuclease/phosphatase family metal-dependent hydrolase